MSLMVHDAASSRGATLEDTTHLLRTSKSKTKRDRLRSFEL